MNAQCPSCGAPVEAGAIFCDNCGVKLAPPAPIPAAIPAAAPAPAAPGMCPKCGHSNVPGSMFCENCGEPLSKAPAPAPVAQPPVPPAVPQQPVLPQQPAWAPPAATAITGQFILVATGVSIPVPPGKQEILLGREDPVSQNFPEINLDPYDGLNNGVSRKHARISLQSGQLMIEDLNAVNYTHLNGQRMVPGQKYPLKSGDVILLGKLGLTYQA